MSVRIVTDSPTTRRRIFTGADSSVWVVNEEYRAFNGGRAWVVARIEPVRPAYTVAP